MYDFKEDLLCCLLNCGDLDINLLSDCGYELCDIVDDCKATFGEVNINNLVRIMFDYGLRDIETAINDRICEIEAVAGERDLDEDEENELEALRGLEPFDDIQSFHNFIDTHIWVDDDGKKETYKKYLQEALDEFEKMTGFEIGT